jgi:hypothetical protein
MKRILIGWAIALLGTTLVSPIYAAKKTRLKLPACGMLVDNPYLMPPEEAKRMGIHT